MPDPPDVVRFILLPPFQLSVLLTRSVAWGCNGVVADMALDGVEEPKVFLAVTVNEYDVFTVSPVTVIVPPIDCVTVAVLLMPLAAVAVAV